METRKEIDLFRGAGDLADERVTRKFAKEHVRESQEEIDKDRSLKLIEGLTTQKKISLYATASVAHFSNWSGSSVPSPVGFKVYQWITDEIDADQMTRETYVKYVKELHVWSHLDLTEESRPWWRNVHGVHVHGDPEAMMNRIVDDTRLEAISDQEDLLQSVVNAQLKEFHN